MVYAVAAVEGGEAQDTEVDVSVKRRKREKSVSCSERDWVSGGPTAVNACS